MKYKLLSALLASSVLLMGCGSDSDNDNDDGSEVIPPAPEAVEIADATSINLVVASYDGATGAMSFSLSDDDGKAITKVTDYDITYFGYPSPDSPSTKAKAWKRWHVTQGYGCQSGDSGQCQGILTETATLGSYTFEAIDLDLDAKAAAGAVALYKVAIEIHGGQVSNEIELIAAD